MSAFASIRFRVSGHQGVPLELHTDATAREYGYNLARMCIPGSKFPGMQEALDEILIAADVVPISAFADYTDDENEGRRFEGLPPIEPNWFPVEDGFKTVETLLGALRQRGIDEDYLWELRVAHAVFKSAVGRGETFCFAIS
jgi:hypothetical protein